MIEEAEAAAIAADLYGLQAGARALPGEYDDNFHLRTADGRGFVLKLMHPARERALVELQCEALAHIARRAPELWLPRVCPTRRGELIPTARGADAAERLVWMLTHLPGRPLAEAKPHTSELLRSLGRLLGEMDRALGDFSHPAAERELKWDLSRPLWIRGHLHEIADPSRRALVERVLSLFEAEIVPALPGLRRGVLHGDANDYNVIVGDPRREPRPVSLIDFGDIHHGILIAEAAVAAAYALLGKSDPSRS